MPSNPKLKKLISFVRDHAGGEAGLLGRLRSGSNSVRIARELEALAAEHNIPRDTIALSPDSVRLMLKKFDEPGYHDALKAGAHTLMDETLEIADAVPASREEVQKAKLRIEVRQNLAGKLDRETWGDLPAPAVNIALGTDFLRAVARPGVSAPPRAPAKALPPPAVDADIEEEESPAMTVAYARSDKERVRAKRVDALMREYNLSLKDSERRVANLEHGEGRPAVLDQLPGRPVVNVAPVKEEPDD